MYEKGTSFFSTTRSSSPPYGPHPRPRGRPRFLPPSLALSHTALTERSLPSCYRYAVLCGPPQRRGGKEGGGGGVSRTGAAGLASFFLACSWSVLLLPFPLSLPLYPSLCFSPSLLLREGGRKGREKKGDGGKDGGRGTHPVPAAEDGDVCGRRGCASSPSFPPLPHPPVVPSPNGKPEDAGPGP
jgi:hypothetical protein